MILYHSYYGNEFPMGHLHISSNETPSRNHHYPNQESRPMTSSEHQTRMEPTIPEFRIRRPDPNIQYSNRRHYGGYPPQAISRPTRETYDPRFYNHQSFRQQTEPNSYLTPPRLTHDSETTRSIIPPEPRNAGAPTNRTSYRGRFNPNGKPSPGSSSIKELRENDIVCGRGAPTLFHKGNIKFRNLVLQYQSTYLFSKRPDKPRVAWSLLEIIQSNGGRFVRRVKGAIRNTNNSVDENHGANASCYHWEQLNDRQAYDKICQSLREGAPEVRRRILSSRSPSESETQFQENNMS